MLSCFGGHGVECLGLDSGVHFKKVINRETGSSPRERLSARRQDDASSYCLMTPITPPTLITPHCSVRRIAPVDFNFSRHQTKEHCQPNKQQCHRRGSQ